jgi:hypothetical protein
MTHKDEIKTILDILSNYYIMDDIGLTTKNFCNWGIRTNTNGKESLVLIDNAYLYPIRSIDMVTCQCGGRIVPSDDFTYYRCKNSACAMHYTVAELLNMSRFDYDGEDEEAIKMLSADGTETYIKVSGVNSGVINKIDTDEAEELLNNYKDATSFDMTSANIETDIEDYWLNNTDNDEEEPKYTKLKLGGSNK